MKKLLIPILLISVSSLSFFACSKSDNKTTTPPTVTQSLTATIDGSAFTANEVYAGTSSSGGLSEMYIIGDDTTSSKAIEIGLTPFTSATTTGTYNIGSGGPAFANYTTSTGGVSYATSGQVVITKLDTTAKIVQGSFNFVTHFSNDSSVITGGTFSSLF